MSMFRLIIITLLVIRNRPPIPTFKFRIFTAPLASITALLTKISAVVLDTEPELFTFILPDDDAFTVPVKFIA